MPVKAIGFDYFGTLVEAIADVDACIQSMCKHLHSCGYIYDDQDFLETYRAVVRRHRKKRYEKLQDVKV